MRTMLLEGKTTKM